MTPSARVEQYLHHYAVTGSTDRAQWLSRHCRRYQHVVCVPLFDETEAIFHSLAQVSDADKALVIAVINTPEDASTAAAARTRALHHHLVCNHPQLAQSSDTTLVNFGDTGLNVLVIDRCTDPLPARQGVGLARKLGNDVALALWHKDRVRSEWFYQTDGDATLPAHYFLAPEQFGDAVAMHLNFEHVGSPTTSLSQRLYDLKLDYYVAGLQHATSPYAHYSLGSALAIKADAYASVRGYPRRAAGEDFYLLNKLRKLGRIGFDASRTIRLEERLSTRVPFGTGPAVQTFATQRHPLDTRAFYAPACFDALKLWLDFIAASAQRDGGAAAPCARTRWDDHQDRPLYAAATQAADTLDLFEWLDDTLTHYPKTQWLPQLQNGMDGLKTLRFIHALRDSGLGNVTAPVAQDWLTAFQQKHTTPMRFRSHALVS
ncbi:MAG: hypothetical protein AAF465_12230 [Pseudomonadota bacterium]